MTTSKSDYDRCIEACTECMQECEQCATACLEEPNVKEMARCIALDRDCADICGLAAQWMSRGSQFANTICTLCAEICRTCGDECGRHQMDHCQRCAKACRACAELCEAMAGAAV